MSPRTDMIAWAAGFFEGEGSVTANHGGHKIALGLVNTDLECISLFVDVVGHGRVHTFRPEIDGYKKQYGWNVYGARAITVFEMMRPWLGTRRCARFDELYAIRMAYIAKVTVARECPACGVVFSPPFNNGSSRRRFCCVACKSTHGVRQLRERRLREAA